MSDDCACASCRDVSCSGGCTGIHRALPRVDRRRFLGNVARYALAATAVAVEHDGPAWAAGVADDDTPEQAVNSLGMALTLVPPGRFRMGSEDADDEKPAHGVTISAPLWFGVCETSNAEYRKFVEATGRPEPGVAVEAKKKVRPWENRMYNAPEQPVVCVTWDDATAFCEWLSGEEDAAYRLPTEAEWEHACRAGSQTRFPWGDDPAGRDALYFAQPWPEDTKQAEDFQETSWDLHTVLPVECEEKNAHGMCHVAGNVWEWTADWHGPYSPDAQVDPTGPADGDKNVTRGGSLFHKSRVAASSARRPMPPNSCCRNRGFRVVRED